MKYLGVFTINGKQTIRERETENDLRADMEEIKERELNHFPNAKEGEHYKTKIYKVLEDGASPVYVSADYPTVGKGTKIWHPELSNIHPSVVIGENCKIHSHVWIGENVVIGDNVKIQAFSFIPTGVTIERDVFIGPGVTFTNDKYPPSGNWSNTYVRWGAKIGARATILPGIEIGRDAVIGAGSVVTKDVPSAVTVCGNPAKIHNKSKLPPTPKTDGGVPFDV